MRPLPALALLALPALAAAHPLGNFTVNRYAAVHVTAGAIAVRYVVDMAEIPTFQEMRLLDADGDGTLAAAEREAYLGRMAAALGGNLVLIVDGVRRPLAAGARVLETPPGAGGLPTLRLDLEYAAPLPAARGAVELRDENFAGRAGWQEMIADAAPGLALAGATVPRTDRSAALRAYPADQLQSPPQVRAARFTITPGATGDATAVAPASARVGPVRFSDRLAELVATEAPLSPGLVLTSLLVAAALGALHALSPGHGKTVVGAYLVGARGTARHALFLGLVVTATHTLGVYVLGLVTLTASRYIVPERLFPWLSALSGLIVLGIGASLVVARLAAAGGHSHHGHSHDHAHGHDHDHPHAYGHTHDEHGHSHAPPAGPLGWRNLLALGVSGGLLPCPSALVVMLGAIALGRIAFGLVLIVAFSVGLAAVLTGIGLVLVYARGLFEHLPLDGRFTRYVPVASAVVVSAAGLAIVVEALAQIGVS
jgi:ABC-type nickel/cobalt efflux system permease component RcnA